MDIAPILYTLPPLHGLHVIQWKHSSKGPNHPWAAYRGWQQGSEQHPWWQHVIHTNSNKPFCPGVVAHEATHVALQIMRHEYWRSVLPHIALKEEKTAQIVQYITAECTRHALHLGVTVTPQPIRAHVGECSTGGNL